MSNTKGLFNGVCNRTACSNTPADFYNYSTNMHYCKECAALINKVNPEAKELFGHALCLYGKDREQADMHYASLQLAIKHNCGVEYIVEGQKYEISCFLFNLYGDTVPKLIN